MPDGQKPGYWFSFFVCPVRTPPALGIPWCLFSVLVSLNALSVVVVPISSFRFSIPVSLLVFFFFIMLCYLIVLAAFTRSNNNIRSKLFGRGWLYALLATVLFFLIHIRVGIVSWGRSFLSLFRRFSFPCFQYFP